MSTTATPSPADFAQSLAARREPPPGVFDGAVDKIFCHQFHVQLWIDTLVGGQPTDRNVAEAWLRTKLVGSSDAVIKDKLEELMDARGVKPDEAVAEVNAQRHLTGFRRDFGSPIALMHQQRACREPGVDVLLPDFSGKVRKVFTPEDAARTFGELYIEGRQVKAMIKEAASIAVAAGRVEGTGWGKTRKSMNNFLVEHLFVLENTIPLGVTDPDAVVQSFVHTWRGSGIKLEEQVYGAVVDFTLACDFDFTTKEKDFWQQIFVGAQFNGLGASRSQGYGTFRVTRFDPIELAPARRTRTTKAASAAVSAAE